MLDVAVRTRLGELRLEALSHDDLSVRNIPKVDREDAALRLGIFVFKVQIHYVLAPLVVLVQYHTEHDVFVETFHI